MRNLIRTHPLIAVTQVNLLDLLNTYVMLLFIDENAKLHLSSRLQRVMHSLLATRILLHVREALRNDMGDVITLSDMKFVEGASDTSTDRPTIPEEDIPQTRIES